MSIMIVEIKKLLLVKFQINKKIILGLIIALISFSCSSVKENEDGPYFGNGFKNGWADQNSISIWTRLTKNPDLNKNGVKFLDMELDKKALNKNAKKPNFLIPKQIPDGYTIEEMEGAMPGILGEVKLSYYQNDHSKRIHTDWEIVDTNKNFTNQWKLDGLLSGTKYNIELLARNINTKLITDTLKGEFITAPDSNQIKAIQFGIVSCHDYGRKDRENGHMIYESLANKNLDFYVHTGDITYYDASNPHSFTEKLMRFKWDRLFALPIQRKFFTKTTTYFQKDDHDVLCDDSYPGMVYGDVSFERGLEIFDKEQFPSNEHPYKTIRWGKDLQVWLLEGRNYRSKNTDTDGPEKTILGKIQRDWLFSTLNQSDATFKIIISPTPILGPDRPKGKNDNLSNKAFKYEGDLVRSFINKHKNIYICSGDRHWQYATHYDGTNLWEFGSGPGADKHANGWDQNNKLKEHHFLRVKGGFLSVDVYREDNNAKIKFSHCDVNGVVVNEKVF